MLETEDDLGFGISRTIYDEEWNLLESRFVSWPLIDWGPGPEALTWWFEFSIDGTPTRMHCVEDEHDPYMAEEFGWGSILVCPWPDGGEVHFAPVAELIG